VRYGPGVICPRCGRALPAGEEAQHACAAVPAPSSARPEQGFDKTALKTPTAQLLDGQWRLELKLGEGGMGTVYLAHDIALDRKVAVKLMAHQLLGDPELVDRFEREARVTASLEHPHVVPIYAVGKVEGRPYIVMKRLDGCTLALHLREKGTLTVAETLTLMRQLCSGLELIHARGFIHRDIKSANIFIGPEGHATILDFGILRSSLPSGQTRAGLVMGTPQYMSPEQALGISEIDHRADLYALGVVLFECLSGALPFQGHSDLAVVQQQAHTLPPSVRVLAPNTPPALADVVSRALAKRPEDRFQSAAELLLALESACRTPIPLTTPVRRRTRWIPFGIGAATALAMSAGTGLLLDPDARVRETLSAQVPVGVAVIAPSPEPVGAPTLDLTEEPGPVNIAQRVTPTSTSSQARGATPRRSTLKKTGTLSIVAMAQGESHWAMVTVDGIQRGNSPIELELAPGKHELQVERSGFKRIRRSVTVEAGSASTIRVELRP
jgi:eukaryotic-like serine/threonine-protein kinase